MRSFGRIVLWPVVAILGMLIVGPSPGSIGSCQAEQETVSAYEWCYERDESFCLRDYRRCVNSAAEGTCTDAVCVDTTCNTRYVTCVQPLVASCQGASWGTCDPPTRIEVDACIEALRDPAYLSIPDDGPNGILMVLAVCNDLCSGGVQ